MLEEAIKKIKEEIEKNKGDFYIQEIGKYVLVQVETNKEASEKIAKGEKTIVGSMKFLESEARKRLQKGQQCLMIADVEGFKIINTYFGFKNIQDKLDVEKREAVEKIEEDHTEEKVIEIDFNVNLEDLF